VTYDQPGPVRLVPAAADLPPGLTAGPGWPTDATAHALAFAAAGGLTWYVVDRADAVIGELGTKAPPGDAGTVEIGYGLVPARRGQGLGTAAVAALLTELRSRTDIGAVVARTDAGNLPSRRLLERLGFTVVTVDGPEIGYRLDLR
jgi:RimJ/RimL family protein N-acetyltransferase